MGFFITPIEIWGHRKVKTEFDSKEQENEYITFWTIEMTFLQRLTLLGCVYLCVIWSCHVNGSSSPWLRLKSRSWYIIICIMIWCLLQTLSLSLCIFFHSLTRHCFYLASWNNNIRSYVSLIFNSIPRTQAKRDGKVVISCRLMVCFTVGHRWDRRPSSIGHVTFLHFIRDDEFSLSAKRCCCPAFLGPW